MTPLQRSIVLAAFTALCPALAALPPAAPEVLFRVTPAVRALLGNLRKIDIAPAWRRANWTGPRGQGSCVHAAIAHLLEWQGRHAAAAWWRQHHGDGETPAGLAAKLDAAGIAYAQTRSGDEAFLEWAIRTRRGAAVVVEQGAHMVNLVGLDAHSADLLDSNSPERTVHVSREAFVRDWKQSGGWAVALLAGAPCAPAPWVVRDRVTKPEARIKSVPRPASGGRGTATDFGLQAMPAGRHGILRRDPGESMRQPGGDCSVPAA